MHHKKNNNKNYDYAAGDSSTTISAFTSIVPVSALAISFTL
jgi:hypothetical protein